MLPVKQLTYRQDVDGLRAIAVLAVIFYHYRMFGFSGGYVGVDIFFVISGYLITSILLASFSSGKFSFMQFYARRIRRLYPALLCVVVVSTFFCFFFMRPKAYSSYIESLLYLAFFNTNYLFSTQTGYFDPGVVFKPLLHTWSLSIEEQFYVLYPLFLLFCYKLGVKKIFLVSSFVLSAGLGVYFSYKYQLFSFYMMPSRAFELLLGAIVVLIVPINHCTKTNKVLISAVTFGLIGFPLFFFSEQTLFPGFAVFLPCLGAALILCSTKNTNYVNYLLASKPLVYIGLISYSLYLWHWPLYVFYQQVGYYLFEYMHMSDKGSGTFLLLVMVVFFSLATFKLIEHPARTNKKFFTPKRTIVFFC